MVVDLRGFSGSSTCRGSCRLREVDDLWVKSSGIPGKPGLHDSGNLVLARRDSLLADVRSTVPAEEVARLRYSPLPETASLFPHPLLDSTLLKVHAAASDALVQRTLHPPRIPWKPAAAGQSGGSSTAASG